jgi:hypothetical protein
VVSAGRRLAPYAGTADEEQSHARLGRPALERLIDTRIADAGWCSGLSHVALGKPSSYPNDLGTGWCGADMTLLRNRVRSRPAAVLGKRVRAASTRTLPARLRRRALMLREAY